MTKNKKIGIEVEKCNPYSDLYLYFDLETLVFSFGSNFF